jgi:hypothetical protein
VATLRAPNGVINTYAGIETLKSRAGISGTAQDALLWLALYTAGRTVDGFCNRRFFLVRASRLFDVRDREGFLVPDLVSVVALREDADRDRVFEVTRAAGDYLLYPLNASPEQPWGRPYSRVVADPNGPRPAFTIGRRAVEVDGEWGFRKAFADTGADLSIGGPLSAAATQATVTDGTLVEAGDTALIEQEQVFIRQVSGNDLTLVRGVNGTSAVSHVDGLDVWTARPPAQVSEASLLVAGRLFTRGDNPLAVSAGSYGLGAPKSHAAIDPDAQRLLTPFRRLPLGAAA